MKRLPTSRMTVSYTIHATPGYILRELDIRGVPREAVPLAIDRPVVCDTGTWLNGRPVLHRITRTAEYKYRLDTLIQPMVSDDCY